MKTTTTTAAQWAAGCRWEQLRQGYFRNIGNRAAEQDAYQRADFYFQKLQSQEQAEAEVKPEAESAA